MCRLDQYQIFKQSAAYRDGDSSLKDVCIRVIVTIAITRIFQEKDETDTLLQLVVYNSSMHSFTVVIGCSRKQEHLETPKRIISRLQA